MATLDEEGRSGARRRITAPRCCRDAPQGQNDEQAAQQLTGLTGTVNIRRVAAPATCCESGSAVAVSACPSRAVGALAAE